MVFVGYGVSAPAHGYDDYAAAGSLAGKVVMYLSGAPASLQSTERAYCSSGAVKDAEAVKRGAIGAISFHLARRSALPLGRQRRHRQAGQLRLGRCDGTTQPRRCRAARVSVTESSGCGGALRRRADAADGRVCRRGGSRPQAFDLATRVSLATTSTRKDIESANLVGRVRGSDPQLRDERVVYIAHVDHFGRGVAMQGDDIYNGAHDNASGVAVVLEIAHAAATLPTSSRRSALFLFVTAEERGLLGSDYFARHPTVPRDSLEADLALRPAVPLPPVCSMSCRTARSTPR